MSKDTAFRSEEFARYYIEKALSLPVEHYDIKRKRCDKEHNGRYDLQVKGKDGKPLIAVEVKRFGDEKQMKDIAAALKKFKIDTNFNWCATPTNNEIRFDDTAGSLEPILQYLEQIKTVTDSDCRDVKELTEHQLPKHVKEKLNKLSIGKLCFYKRNQDEEGSHLSFLLEGPFGQPYLAKDRLVQEANKYISDLNKKKRLCKIIHDPLTNQAHVFLLVWLQVKDHKIIQAGGIPNIDPSLPEGVHGLWLVTNKDGLFWHEKNGWRYFEKGWH